MANIENSIQIALQFTKKWEKLASKVKGKIIYFVSPESLDSSTLIYSYPDGSKGRSIGWGTYKQLSDGTSVDYDLAITKEKADYELDTEMRRKEVLVRKQFDPTNLTDTQYAALLDYAYNAGENAFNRNGLKDAILNGGDVETAIKGASTTQDGKVLSNLVNRRKDEAQLWSGNYNDLYSYYLRNPKKVYLIAGGISLAIGGYIFLMIYLRNKRK